LIFFVTETLGHGLFWWLKNFSEKKKIKKNVLPQSHKDRKFKENFVPSWQKKIVSAVSPKSKTRRHFYQRVSFIKKKIYFLFCQAE
jgi:hypothetical protein